MNISGKIFAWMILIAAIPALVWTAKLHGLRNDYSKQVETLTKDNDASALQRDAKQQELKLLNAEFDRTMVGWGRYWKNADVTVVKQDEAQLATSQLGKNNGLGAAYEEATVVHLFREAEGDKPVYTGPFKISTLRDDQAAFEPVWIPRANEAANWAQSNSWWIHSEIPSPYVDRFEHQQNALSGADDRHTEGTKNLRIQNDLVRSSEEHLSYRLGELLGDETATPVERRPEWSEGLMQAIIGQSEQRNAALAEVDKLRREMSNAKKELKRLIDRNKQLVKGLPGSVAADKQARKP
jgi:hypothetical protein